MNLSPPNPWLLRRPETQPQSLNLLCLPHAGSGAAWYLGWAPALADRQVAVLPVQLPGREGRLGEPPLADMAALIDAMLPAVATACRAPYALFGHSAGGRVAYHLAQRLLAAGLPAPACLIVSASRAPHLPPNDPMLHTLGDDELLADIERRYGRRLEPELQELMRLTLPTLRADLRVVETDAAQPRAPLPVPILALAGRDDAGVPVPEVRAWERYTTESFELKVFPGGHFFPMDARDDVLGCIARSLAAIGANSR